MMNTDIHAEEHLEMEAQGQATGAGDHRRGAGALALLLAS